MMKNIFFVGCILFSYSHIIPHASQSYETLCQKFEEAQAWGLHTIIDIKNCNPATIRSKEKITEYVHKLCKLIDMKRFGETVVVHFGEDQKIAGYSMMQLIETSLISGHFANESNAAYLDIFSCKLYDPRVVQEFTVNFFEGTLGECNVLLRK